MACEVQLKDEINSTQQLKGEHNEETITGTN